MSAIILNNLVKYFELSKRRKQVKSGISESEAKNAIIHAVDNISFEVNRGEIFGLLGPNGAGKTTIIRMMTGVLKPSKGIINIFGFNIWQNQIAVKQRIGNVPEMANIYISFSGWQNLMFIGEIYGVSKEEKRKRAENLLKQFDLYDKRDLKARKYSKGMKQRLLLCMALMSNPKILFLDEPTSGLDIQSGRIIKQIIREYNKQGVTIFLTTHNMDVANELCDRIAIIQHGKIISLDTPQNIRDLTQEYQAIDLKFFNGVKEINIEDLSTVRKIHQNKEGFHIIVNDIHEAICEIIDYIKINKIIIKHISTHEPRLEEAFLKIIERGDKNE